MNYKKLTFGFLTITLFLGTLLPLFNFLTVSAEGESPWSQFQHDAGDETLVNNPVLSKRLTASERISIIPMLLLKSVPCDSYSCFSCKSVLVKISRLKNS